MSIWRAPLVPIALAFTAGVLLDRFVFVPFWFSVVAVLAFILSWFAVRNSRQLGLALIYLWCSCIALGALYHHWFREDIRPNDLHHFASAEPTPVLLRGVLHTEPHIVPKTPPDPLRTYQPKVRSRAVLQATDLFLHGTWQPVSGHAMMNVTGSLADYHVGDEIEAVCRLFEPSPPSNPGEMDYKSYLYDRGIRTTVVVVDAKESVRRISKRWPTQITGWLAMIRAWANDVLHRHLPEPQSHVASALLLGDTNAMSTTEWEKYLQTGVIHVLAISGQHLVVLAGFMWLVLRLIGTRRRTGAVIIALFLLGYALLTGGRPPVMRSACAMLALCGGMLLRRPIIPANVFSLAWLIVLFLNPNDVTNSGCLLSFLSVAVLAWGVRSIIFQQPDPLQQTIDETRAAWKRTLRGIGDKIRILYLVNAMVWLAVMPLVAQRFNVVSPIALLIGPVMVLLTSIALLAGFALLLFGAVFAPLAWLSAFVVNATLSGCDAIVSTSAQWDWSFWYVPPPATWWLVVFYAGLLMWLMHASIWRFRKCCLFAAIGWLFLLPISSRLQPHDDEFRCTFLSVGHGGCTVIETPDGRVLLYDAGAINGPDVTRRQIAPFLWQRGIRRIDELFLSHADLDHFNGVPALLERFHVGRVTVTWTFRKRMLPGVQMAIREIQNRGIAIQVVQAGDTLHAGEVSLRVLHPPMGYLGPKENEHSMVLLVGYQDRSILLTGDLEKVGMKHFLRKPPTPVDVLMAPHHGSASASPKELANWAKPKVVISSQKKPIFPRETAAHYQSVKAGFLPTSKHGAVTVRIRNGELSIETFVTKKNWRY